MNRYIVLCGIMFFLIIGCNQEDNSGGLKDSFKQESNFLKNLKEEDISSVKIESRGLNKVLLLKGDRYKTFITEFLEILKREPIYHPEGIYSGHTIAADFYIFITFRDGKHKEFHVLGRGVLADISNKTSYQFYMGLLIYQWLKE